MNKKNNKIKRGFIPQSIGDVVKKINKKFTSKFGKYEFIIHSNWSNSVGIYFSKFSADIKSNSSDIYSFLGKPDRFY